MTVPDDVTLLWTDDTYVCFCPLILWHWHALSGREILTHLCGLGGAMCADILCRVRGIGRAALECITMSVRTLVYFSLYHAKR
jgi:hypothetical protein